MVHRSFRRQAAGAAQLYFPHPQPDPIRESAEGEGQAPQASGQAKIRRSGVLTGKVFRGREILIVMADEPLTRATLKTPKAAAIAGMLFSLLLIIVFSLL